MVEPLSNFTPYPDQSCCDQDFLTCSRLTFPFEYQILTLPFTSFTRPNNPAIWPSWLSSNHPEASGWVGGTAPDQLGYKAPWLNESALNSASWPGSWTSGNWTDANAYALLTTSSIRIMRWRLTANTTYFHPVRAFWLENHVGGFTEPRFFKKLVATPSPSSPIGPFVLVPSPYDLNTPATLSGVQVCNTGIDSSNCQSISCSTSASGGTCHCSATVFCQQTLQNPFDSFALFSFVGSVDDEFLFNGEIIDPTCCTFSGCCNGAHSVNFSTIVGPNESLTIACGDNHGSNSSISGTACFSLDLSP